MTQVTVTEIHIYPVKSMRGIALEKGRLTPLGLEHDRRWMVVRENGRFVTQRELNRLALVQPRLVDGGIELELEGHGRIAVPTKPRGPRFETVVWNDPCEVVSAGQDVSDWLTEGLHSETRLHLTAMAPGFVRAQTQPQRMGASTTTVFADASPYLVASQDSLDALNRELESRSLAAVPMNRFRPNLVIRGLEPFAEHRAGTLTHPRFVFAFRDRCERCVMTTIDQASGVRDPEQQPFRTLAELNPMPGKPRSPAFAENATLEAGAGETLSVGDLLEVNGRAA